MMRAQVYKHFGGGPRVHALVAEALGCTPENVLMWPEDEPIPEAPAMKLHVITNGKLRADVELYAKIKVERMRSRVEREGEKRLIAARRTKRAMQKAGAST